jgi:hypothetical protein
MDKRWLGSITREDSAEAEGWSFDEAELSEYRGGVNLWLKRSGGYEHSNLLLEDRREARNEPAHIDRRDVGPIRPLFPPSDWI